MAFTFGSPAVTSASTGFGFTAQKPTTGFGLTNTSFGTPTTTSGTLTFGALSTPTTSIGLNFGFGTSATSTPAQCSNLLLGSNTATTMTTAPSLFPTPTTSTPLFTGLSFGTPATTNTLTFGATSNTTATGSLTFGTATTNTPLFGSGTGSTLLGSKPTTVLTTTTTSKGLGGLDVSVNNKGLSQGNSSSTAAKENLLPNELMQTIDKFKEFVKMQKGLSSDIARGSARPLNRCAEDTASLMEMLSTLSGSVQRDRSSADKLKQDTARALQSSEIAQRTHDTPAGLQYENNMPLQFFMELAENFEQDLMLFRSQIETTEKHIQTMMAPRTLTPQELTATMSKLHESLVAVAGRLQSVHAKVQQQKEQYLNFRKYLLKDNTNVFDSIKVNNKSNRSSIGKITSGPTPFGPGNKNFLSSTTLNSNRPASYETRNPLVWESSTPVPSATNIAIGSSTKPPTASLNFNAPINLTSPLPVNGTSSNFQLQKPPVGNKRGKH
ncbi:PREDICTED: probable nucleoporin Nup58 isoform X1 [Acromyrmex echinatior]|uniref:Putative nucleoporin Nup58 n=1 Tax=Acromyrmex echinatior TaxID=103372 RepID=F4WIE6_ACREC|nr:PREDICTED: probable nucleoporin Nup58 isoform X1 [Acromyrmex echinatior]EGI66077.1 Putative nucleoporin Nup58 [Acromyrmex echinatior]